VNDGMYGWTVMRVISSLTTLPMLCHSLQTSFPSLYGEETNVRGLGIAGTSSLGSQARW
jgi:hypothetical protein